jgi:hypothetical protein
MGATHRRHAEERLSVCKLAGAMLFHGSFRGEDRSPCGAEGEALGAVPTFQRRSSRSVRRARNLASCLPWGVHSWGFVASLEPRKWGHPESQLAAPQVG